VALALATAFGAGYAPIAPGTFGSIVGLVLWAALPASPAIHAAVIAGVCVVGSWSASIAEQHFARTDPSHVVIDEVLGMLITLFASPVGWPGAILGFLLFRVADVIKPFPANRLERLPGGLGVMADDAWRDLCQSRAPILHLVIWSSGHLVSDGSVNQLTAASMPRRVRILVWRRIAVNDQITRWPR
jgi:phosphatidylglycerophosphatase A